MAAGAQRIDDVDGFVEWQAGAPGAALDGRVIGYTGYREDMAGPVHRTETPDGW